MVLNDRYWELLSAMQKSVRRGQELDAGRFFFELIGDGYFSLAFNRLRVIAYEDIGLGDPIALLLAEQALTRTIEWRR